MSTSKEIQEVYLADIAEKSKRLRLKQGLMPWLRQFSTNGDGIDELSRRSGLGCFQIVELFEELAPDSPLSKLTADDLIDLVSKVETPKK